MIPKIPHGYYYLATVYSKNRGGTDLAFVEASTAAGKLLEQGIFTYCPIAHTHPLACYANLDRFSYDLFMPLDEVFMRHAYGCIVVMQPGWQESKEVQQEIAYFEARKKPIHYLSWPDLQEATTCSGS